MQKTTQVQSYILDCIDKTKTKKEKKIERGKPVHKMVGLHALPFYDRTVKVTAKYKNGNFRGWKKQNSVRGMHVRKVRTRYHEHKQKKTKLKT